MSGHIVGDCLAALDDNLGQLRLQVHLDQTEVQEERRQLQARHADAFRVLKAVEVALGAHVGRDVPQDALDPARAALAAYGARWGLFGEEPGPTRPRFINGPVVRS